MKLKELQKSKTVTLFFLPEFCQKMRGKWGRKVENLVQKWSSGTPGRSVRRNSGDVFRYGGCKEKEVPVRNGQLCADRFQECKMEIAERRLQ
jgi:hypothetical protein